ncbi:MAG TPA: penicillin-binding protein 1C, partial [Flavitalea sp.]|nr:penicillin-binding protein 1C [Flavitalea sp.]
MTSRKKIFIRLKNSAVFLLTVFILFFLLNLLFPLPDKIQYSTIVTDNKNEVIHAFLTEDEKWRMKMLPHEISPLLRKTIIRKEDKYFYYHPGINPLAVLRAIFNNLISNKRTSGASTITMQVARSLEPGRRTWLKKVAEMFRALQLEWKYSKEEILLLYINHIPYGGNIEGVKSAAVLYFEKNPDHLSLAEVVTLSIIPNRPSSLVIGRNNQVIVTERNRWLKRFEKEKLFTQNEISDALAEPLSAYRHSVPQLIPHLSLKLKQEGGDVIHTCIDLNTQQKVDKLVKDNTRRLYLKNIRNAAVIVIDNRTHEVISYTGSADFYDTTDAGQVNGAAAVRQPGSTLKPLLYAMCFDEGIMTPHSSLLDVAVNYSGYTPENYDRKFYGTVSMKFALDHSLNVPAVQALGKIGKEKFIQKLALADFDQVKKDQKKLGLSLILGGCGATLEELTVLYTTFAHEGKYFSP